MDTDFKRLLSVLLSVLFVTGCCSLGGLLDGPDDSSANLKPTVSSTVPANLATDVTISQIISATFSEPMLPSTITAGTFTLSHGATQVPGSVTYNGLIATFRPASPLDPDTLYTATITSAAKDLSGAAMAKNYIWTFRTAASLPPGVIPPTVSSTVPANAEQDVAFNIRPSATFSEAMDPATISATTFTLYQGTTAVSGSVTYSGVTATFRPGSNLSPNTVYTATITTGARNLEGVALVSNYVWTFETGATPDTTPPTVSSTVPANGDTGVAINIKPTATFSEAMDPQTINTTTFTLRQGTTPVSGNVTYAGVTAAFAPSGNLAPNTLYTATITTGSEDLAGNALVSDYVWTFETGSISDTTPPMVISTVPDDGDTNVALNIKPTATFSEAMDPQTINTFTFKLKQGTTSAPTAPVSGSVTYAGVTATFTPLGNLSPNTLYTATITTRSQDLAGNALVSDYIWTFETGAAPDNTPPTVISTVPDDGDINVALSVKPTATFSEAMNVLTINTTTFTLRQGSTPVPGNVTYAGLNATFTPLSNLAPNTLYTATITTGSEDLGGNALVSDYVWTFTTGDIPDDVAPTVVSTIPADGDGNVPINVAPSATFSEAMDASTIISSTFTLHYGTTYVLGDVTYVGLVATFTPNDSLEANTEYTATITTEATDLAGNALISNYIWTFTTALVDLGAADPFGGFGGGAGMTNQGIFTVVNGDIGTTAASTLITGFHDSGGNIFTETPLNIGLVTGIIYTAPPPPGDAVKFAIASQAAIDAQIAFDSLSPASMPGGTDPGAGELGGLVLAPGVYMAAGGTFQITGSDLTLDGQGDDNAIWVFQCAASLTVGDTAPRSIILINGAHARNVFWYVGSAATINGAGGGTMVGTIIASAGVTFSTAGNVTLTVLDGRALGLNASVTLVNTIINVPQ